ncbi:hypothetical protein GXW82_41165 [Streptacidiphilus sp. 4-A2]|nr:hypothetical protein [Streptacidiphilus sp. 4-A2]
MRLLAVRLKVRSAARTRPLLGLIKDDLHPAQKQTTAQPCRCGRHPLRGPRPRAHRRRPRAGQQHRLRRARLDALLERERRSPGLRHRAEPHLEGLVHVADGALQNVYYPETDEPDTYGLQYYVTDGSGFTDSETGNTPTPSRWPTPPR